MAGFTLLDVITEQRRYIDIETSYTDVLLDAYRASLPLNSGRCEPALKETSYDAKDANEINPPDTAPQAALGRSRRLRSGCWR